MLLNTPTETDAVFATQNLAQLTVVLFLIQTWCAVLAIGNKLMLRGNDPKGKGTARISSME